MTTSFIVITLILIREAQKAVTTNPIAPVCLSWSHRSPRWKFHIRALVLQPIVSKRHPAASKLLRSHPVSIICYRKCAAYLVWKDNINATRASIPCIRN